MANRAFPFRARFILRQQFGQLTAAIFAQLIKVYGAPSEGEGRYSPAEVIDTEVVPVIAQRKAGPSRKQSYAVFQSTHILD
jgi:hypothetical protein